MELANDGFFEELCAQRCDVVILEFGHHAQSFMEIGVKLAPEIFTAQTHLSASLTRVQINAPGAKGRKIAPGLPAENDRDAGENVMRPQPFVLRCRRGALGTRIQAERFWA